MNARALVSRQLEISACLQHAGPLKQKLHELDEAERAAIEAAVSDAVHPADVDELNRHILQRKSIQMVFNLLDELKEELHPDEVTSDAE